MLEPSLPTSIRYQVETWADDLVPVVIDMSVPVLVLSPDFDFLPDDGRTPMVTRFHEGWEAAIREGAALEHRVVPGARFLVWEDASGAVTQAVGDIARRRAQR